MSKEIEKQKRIENYENLRIEMKSKGYHERICTISVLKANLMAFVATIPIIAVCLIIYLLKWRSLHFNISPIIILIFITALIACVFIHEIIHGLTCGLFCKNKWKSIHLGVIWKAFTPYCH